MGFVYDGESYIYSGDEDPFDLGFSFHFTNQKNSPNFNPDDLPWHQMPDYVKQIINMEVSSYMPSSNNFNIPIVVVRVRPSLVEVYVGINCFLGRLSNASGSFSLFSVNNSADLYSNSRCYTAIYTHNGSIYQDWSECAFTKYGDHNSVYQVAPYFFGNMDSGNLDYYVWGGNAARIGNYTSIAFPVDSTDSNITISLYQSSAGFSSGRYLPYQDQYPFQYFEYFSPLTDDDYQIHLQQEQNETSKGIWETLKGIPEAIGENIKGLFVPSDGFFDTYQQEFQTYFRERFGILYEIPELVISLLQKFVTFNPKEDNYSITFPEVKLPVLEDGEWREEKLIEAQDFSFDFINEAPFSLLYDAYVAFIWLVYILLLVNLIKYKANSVFKGG